jgi:hypothetical protein
MFNALKTDLENWKTSIENAVKAHTHAVAGVTPGNGAVTSAAPESFTTTLDISSAEAKKVKTS